MRWIAAFLGWVLCWTTILGGSVILGGSAERSLPKNRFGKAIAWGLGVAGLIGGIAIVVHLTANLPDDLSWKLTYSNAFRLFFTTSWGWGGLVVSAAGLWVAGKIGRRASSTEASSTEASSTENGEERR